MSHTKALINEGFYLLAQRQTNSNSSKYYKNDEEIFKKCLPIIPKV